MAEDLLRRRKRRESFTIISNEPINNPKLRFEDIGLLSYILSKPEDWIIYKSQVISSHGNGRESVAGIFRRLEENGYLQIIKHRNDKGQFSYNEYVFSDSPWEFDDETVDGNPYTASRQRETVDGNPTPTNTIYTNTINTKEEEEKHPADFQNFEQETSDSIEPCLSNDEQFIQDNIKDFASYTGTDMTGKAAQDIYNKWRYDWGFSHEMIMLAGQLMTQLAKAPNLSYVDRILSDWMNRHIRSVPEATQAIESYRARNHDNKSGLPITKNARKSNICDTTGREYEYYIPPDVQEELCRKGGSV